MAITTDSFFGFGTDLEAQDLLDPSYFDLAFDKPDSPCLSTRHVALENSGVLGTPQLPQDLTTKPSKPAPRPRYACVKCNKQFTNKKTLGRHLHDLHGIKGFPCAHCPICVTRYDNLQSHYQHCKGLKITGNPAVTQKPMGINRPRPPARKRVSAKTLLQLHQQQTLEPEGPNWVHVSAKSPSREEAAAMRPGTCGPEDDVAFLEGLGLGLPYFTFPQAQTDQELSFDPRTENNVEVLRREYLKSQKDLEVKKQEAAYWREQWLQQI